MRPVQQDGARCNANFPPAFVLWGPEGGQTSPWRPFASGFVVRGAWLPSFSHRLICPHVSCTKHPLWWAPPGPQPWRPESLPRQTRLALLVPRPVAASEKVPRHWRANLVPSERPLSLELVGQLITSALPNSVERRPRSSVAVERRADSLTAEEKDIKPSWPGNWAQIAPPSKVVVVVVQN